MRRVYIPNKSAHDFSGAEIHGDLVYLTEGSVSRYNVSKHHREFSEKMYEAQEDDLLLITSLNILNAIGSAILANKFGRVNFLLWHDGKYIKRTLFLTPKEDMHVEDDEDL